MADDTISDLIARLRDKSVSACLTVEDLCQEAAIALVALQAEHPYDIRAAGWNVAIHNDYAVNGENWTFWLFTNQDGRWIKGEGKSDAEALDHIRAALAGQEPIDG